MYTDINQRLNLLINSPEFAYRVYPDGSMDVLTPTVITDDEYEYWVGADITLKSGKKIPGVFVIKNGGASHVRIYFRIDGAWKASDNKKVPSLLKMDKSEIFPINWKYNIQVDNDIFHK